MTHEDVNQSQNLKWGLTINLYSRTTVPFICLDELDRTPAYFNRPTINEGPENNLNPHPYPPELLFRHRFVRYGLFPHPSVIRSRTDHVLLSKLYERKGWEEIGHVHHYKRFCIKDPDPFVHSSRRSKEVNDGHCVVIGVNYLSFWLRVFLLNYKVLRVPQSRWGR